MDNPLKEVKELLSRPLPLVCFTIFSTALVLGICGCTAISCQSMSQSDAERAKYRAMQSESFWKYNK